MPVSPEVVRKGLFAKMMFELKGRKEIALSHEVYVSHAERRASVKVLRWD